MDYRPIFVVVGAIFQHNLGKDVLGQTHIILCM
jgi:hypothetical protein